MTTSLSKQDFLNTFKYFSDQPHQIAAVEALYDALPADLKQDESEWVELYRNKKQEEPKGDHHLEVEYYSQRDNYRDANRTCFSSSLRGHSEEFFEVCFSG